jgi:hypothetical protein
MTHPRERSLLLQEIVGCEFIHRGGKLAKSEGDLALRTES